MYENIFIDRVWLCMMESYVEFHCIENEFRVGNYTCCLVLYLLRHRHTTRKNAKHYGKYETILRSYNSNYKTNSLFFGLRLVHRYIDKFDSGSQKKIKISLCYAAEAYNW